MLTDIQMQELAHCLENTCDDIETGLSCIGIDPQREDLDLIECELSSTIDVCSICGWWSEISELNEDNACEKCCEEGEDLEEEGEEGEDDA